MALYKRGSIYWISYTDPNGKRVRCSTNVSGKKQAQEFFDKLKHESWRASKLGDKPRRTWDEAAALWIKEKAYKKSIDFDIFVLQRIINPVFSGLYLDKITREDIASFAERKRKTLAPSSVNRYLVLMRSIFNRAVRIWGWMDKAPAIMLYKAPKGRIRYLTQDDVDRLMIELPEHLKPIVAFALLTGLRKSNVLNLRWTQIDQKKGIVIIPGSEMKNGENHVVHLSKRARSVISSQKGKHDEYVFTFRGRNIKRIDGAFRNALKRAKISDYRFHDNRHTWASTLIQNGVSLYELQAMGAWKDPEMVKRYAHLAPEKLRENAEIVDVLFGNSLS